MSQSSTPATLETLTGAPVKHFSIFLHNKVGALLEVVKFFEQKGVVVLAFCIIDSAESSIARMIFGHNADERLINLFKRLYFKELYVLPGNHQAGYKQLIERVQDNILLPTASEYKQVHFVPNYLEAVVNGQTIIMNHYAQATWNGQHKGAWHLHSHSHGNLYKSELGKLLYKSKTIDVGVEVCSEPISFAELRAKFRGYDQITFDHHK